MRVGVDVGGTKIECVRVDDDGHVLARHRVPTEAQRSRLDVLENIFSCIDAVWSDDVRGVGIGLPGIVKDGVCTFNPNIEVLVGCAIVAETKKRFGVPVVCANDADCFALAEHRLGAGVGSHHMIGLIIGTGVGSGLIIDGRLFSGASGSGGEVGHMRLLDGSGWEDHLPGPAIRRRYMMNGGADPRPHPSMVWSSDEPAAVRTRNEVTRDIGLFLASLINAFNPELIVVGGGISRLPFYDDIAKAARPHCVPGSFAACRIVPHALGDSAGVLGAAMLIE